MVRRIIIIAASAGLAVAGAAPAADAAVFTGSVEGRGMAGPVDPDDPDDPCRGFPFAGTTISVPGTGQSSVGGFGYRHDLCLSGIDGPSQGSFTFDFGDGSFAGTMVGGSTPSGTPFVGNVRWTYTILEGTGRFAGATGIFTGMGTSDASSRPSVLKLTFDGLVDAPALPEPATWALLLAGFGLTGAALRRAGRGAARVTA